jgi:hypothetical protein
MKNLESIPFPLPLCNGKFLVGGPFPTLDSVPDLLGPTKFTRSDKSSQLAYGLKALPGPPIFGELGPFLPPASLPEGISRVSVEEEG